MEEKKQKISLRTIIIGIGILIGISVGVGIYYVSINKCSEYNGMYQKISYTSEKAFSNTDFINSSSGYRIITDYSSYNEILKNIETCYDYEGTNINKFDSIFFNNNALLAVECCELGNSLTTELLSVLEDNSIVNVKIFYDSGSGPLACDYGDIYFIPISQNIKCAKIEYKYPKRINIVQGVEKPIIYLYPTKEINATVKLLQEDKIICSYPKYVDSWNVLANPNGELMDLNTGRQLYSLYYESESVEEYTITNEGFVVKGENSAKFLEEKLAVLGLTEREAEEFIIYWLPKLEGNKYNYIRFATNEEINNNMPLEINPNPDTIIRVLMIFRGLESPMEVEEQKLDTHERKGFTVVEWGGTEIK